jgi:hypothetical protein
MTSKKSGAEHVEPVRLTCFVSGYGLPEHSLIGKWEEAARRLKVNLEVQVIDILKSPEKADFYDIVFTPTLQIALPSGRHKRFVGQNTDAENILSSLIRFSETALRLQGVTHDINSILEINRVMYSDAVKMHVDINEQLGNQEN